MAVCRGRPLADGLGFSLLPDASARSTLGCIGVRVLIVDDDVVFRDTIAAALTELGYEVVGRVGTLGEARSAVDELRPDAMLLDVNLPDGDGAAFVGTTREGRPRVLLTSSDPEAVTPLSLRRSGAAGFVVKTELLVTDLQPYLG